MSRDLILKSTALLFAAITLVGCSPGAKKARILDRADSYFKAGEYDKAKIEYMNLLRLDNQNVTALQQLGLIWYEEGAPIRAIPFLYRIRDLAPQNIPARTKLGLALMAVNDLEEVRKEAVAILAQDPSNGDAIFLLADASRSKYDITDAEQQLDKFPQKDTAAFHLASASLAARKGEIGAASEQVQQALAAEPKSARAHLVLGYLYLLRKDPSRAGAELKAAADLAPLRSQERLKYVQFQAQNGSAEEAKATLQAMTREAPDYLPAWQTLAQIAFDEKKYDESLALLQNIVARDSDNPDAGFLQSRIWLAKGDGAKSVAVLDRLNQTYPNNEIVKYQLAQAYLVNNNPAQAIAMLEQVVAARPNFAEAILQLAQLNLQSGKPLPVVTALEDLLKKRPDLQQARLILADAYQAVGRLDDAANLFRDQIKGEQQSAADPYFLLGTVLRGQKKNSEARQAFEKAVELEPDNILAIEQLVDLDLESKNFPLAERRVQQQLEKNPSSPAAYFVAGKVNTAQGQWDKAASAFQKAIDLDPKFSKAYELLISTYFAANKLPEAVTQLESLLAKNPEDLRALLMLALVNERQKDFAKAREDYERILSKNPNFLPALNNLAYLDTENFNDLDKAYELAQKAHNLLPGDGATTDTLGWVLYKRGDYQQALIFLQQAAAKVANNPVIQFHLGMAFYMTGQPDAARIAFERAAHSSADFPEKSEAQKRLASLQGSTAGKSEWSTSELEAQVKEQPNDVILLRQLAEAYENQGDNAKSAATYEQMLKVNPKLPAIAVKLAQLYAGPLRDPNKAFEFAKKARELAPNDGQAAGALGRVAFQTGNFTWAYGLLQESGRRGPDDPQVLHDLAMTAYFLGKLPEARETMQRALNAKPDAAQSDDAKRFLAMTALNEPSKAVGARSEIEQILKEQPDYAPALMAQAAIGVQEKNLNAAADIYSGLLRKYPDFVPAQKQLAAIYADDPQNLAKAYDLAMKARKAMPEDPEAARTLGELSFKRNEFSYAAQLFRESNSKQPLPAKDLYYWGMAQLRSRQEAEGRKTLEQALSAGLDEPLAGEARKRLAEGQPGR
jgi:tetratricopeptide (TPR) repeat protein